MKLWALRCGNLYTDVSRPTDADQAKTSLETLTALDAEILTSHDIDQWSDVKEASLIHAA